MMKYLTLISEPILFEHHHTYIITIYIHTYIRYLPLCVCVGSYNGSICIVRVTIEIIILIIYV